MAQQHPTELPLFPLQLPLFPEGWLSLRVFEPRYLAMVRRCHSLGEPFGVVRLIEGTEVRRRDDADGFMREQFESVGTLAHIHALESPQPGLLLLRCRGGQRFALQSSHCLQHGLWMGQGRLLDDDAALAVPADLAALAPLLQSLLHSLAQGAADADLPMQPPYRWQDCGWLANRWAELLPLADAERQHLLMTESPLLRLELVADRLEQLGILPGFDGP
jgi:Lon protease-like protein